MRYSNYIMPSKQIVQGRKKYIEKIKDYWSLSKSLQTGLLLLTGFAGYVSARCPVMTFWTTAELLASMYLAISGSTVLNMVLDRDIDSKMDRTCNRPLPSERIRGREATAFGILIGTIGVLWAFSLERMYGLVILAGILIDVFIYTLWLKRRTAWSILWGGVAGGMPILAGRILAVGTIDWVGIAMFASVLFWIPTHILTFNIRYKEDYAKAGIPTFPQIYGDRLTTTGIALASIATAISMGFSAYGVGMAWGYLRLLLVLSAGLFFLAIYSLRKPSLRANFGLFKYASLYMLGSMALMVIAAY
jgi:protoheme IX farnesyltransferase